MTQHLLANLTKPKQIQTSKPTMSPTQNKTQTSQQIQAALTRRSHSAPQNSKHKRQVTRNPHLKGLSVGAPNVLSDLLDHHTRNKAAPDQSSEHEHQASKNGDTKQKNRFESPRNSQALPAWPPNLLLGSAALLLGPPALFLCLPALRSAPGSSCKAPDVSSRICALQFCS